MGLFELFLVAVGLSMDAFAVSVCKGLSLGKISKKHMCIAGLWFGGFQAGMPLLGYFLGRFLFGCNHRVGSLDCLYSSCTYRWKYGKRSFW